MTSGLGIDLRLVWLPVDPDVAAERLKLDPRVRQLYHAIPYCPDEERWFMETLIHVAERQRNVTVVTLRGDRSQTVLVTEFSQELDGIVGIRAAPVHALPCFT